MENKKITIQVSVYEASMLSKMRKYRYGTFKITKMDGEPRRIVTEGSEAIDPKDALELDEVREYIKKDV